MSFVPWSSSGSFPSVGDSGENSFARRFWKKERKSSRRIVSLRVPGAVDYQKPSTAPDVIRICQDPQRKLRKKLAGFGFVVVPEMSNVALEKRQSFEFQTSTSSSVPSIKRCSLDEIEAVNYPMEKNSTNATKKSTQPYTKVYKTPLRHTPSHRMGITT